MEETVRNLEKIRKKYKLYGIILYCAPVLIVLGLMGSIINPLIGFIGFIVSFISVFMIPAMSSLRNKAKKEYRDTYKERVVEKILGSYFENARYYPTWGITKEEFEKSGVFFWEGSLQGRFFLHSEDLIRGSYRGVEFEQVDVELRRFSAIKHKVIVDVNGRLVKFHYSKAIRGSILIASSGFIPIANSVNFGGEGGILAPKRPDTIEKGLNRISMEDVDFNNKYTVYANDPHSVFYLLTPHFMEYLKQLHNMDRQVSISFDGENLNILRTGSGGVFEISIDKPLNISAEIEKIQQEVQEIVRCVEALHLEKR